MGKNLVPLLSICIPTYNRGYLLQETLASIVEDETFLNTDEVEIVISDNCSEDNTQEICEKFVNQFPTKIFYHKTETNIGGDANFTRVLKLANGKLLKLNNDKCSYLHNSITKIVNWIKENNDEQYVLFFPNKLNKRITKEKDFICNNLNEFIAKTYYMSTWIGAFSIWKNDFENFEDFTRYQKYQLLQNDVLYRQITSGKPIKVFNEQLFEVLRTVDNGGYNPAEVFGHNYLFILGEYLDKGFLDKKVFETEKKRVLLKLILPFYFDYKNKYVFKQTGMFKHLMPIYKNNCYFYLALVSNGLKKIIFPIFQPLRGIYNLIWYNTNIIFYSALKNEEKVFRYKKKLQYEKDIKEEKYKK